MKNPILDSLIAEFSNQTSLDSQSISVQFEHFCAFLLFQPLSEESILTDNHVSGPGETGLDAVAILLDGKPILSPDEAETHLKQKPSSSSVLTVVFLQSKYSSSFKRTEILAFADAAEDLLNPTGSLPQDGLLQEARETLESIFQSASRLNLKESSCFLYFATAGIWQEQAHAKNALSKAEENIKQLNLFARTEAMPIDLHRLRHFHQRLTSKSEAVLPTLSSMAFPPMPGVRNAIVALVRVQELAKHVLCDEGGMLRRGLFDSNVRDFQGPDNPVNNAIAHALTSGADLQKRFCVMNNGITIVADSAQQNGSNYVLKQFQIVNGCQTSSVIHANLENISSDPVIQVRIIEADDEDVLEGITKATNSQTSIPDHQFVANTPKVIEIQDFFRVFPQGGLSQKLFFERRTSEFRDIKQANLRTMTIPDLAKSFSAIFLRKPHVVARAPNRVFSEMRGQLFQAAHDPLQYYVAALSLYRIQALKFSSKISLPEHRLFWHVMAMAFVESTGELPSANFSRKQKLSCEKLLRNLSTADASVSLFKSAHNTILSRTSGISRDRLKRQQFTDEYLFQEAT